jgi:hypothetical protein
MEVEELEDLLMQYLHVRDWRRVCHFKRLCTTPSSVITRYSPAMYLRFLKALFVYVQNCPDSAMEEERRYWDPAHGWYRVRKLKSDWFDLFYKQFFEKLEPRRSTRIRYK